jgi:hypothetical protein
MSTYDGAYSSRNTSSDIYSWMGYVPADKIVELKSKNLDTAEFVEEYKKLAREYK